MKSTWVKMRAMSSPNVLMKFAIVVKCGLLSPHKAMKVTCSRQARSMPRLPTMPCEYAKSTTFKSIRKWGQIYLTGSLAP